MIPSGYRKRLRIWRGELRLAWLRFTAGCAHALGLRRPFERRLARLVHSTGLFDLEWYADTNPDVVQDGTDPLLHYVRYGDREGRQPMPLFDPAYYRAHLDGILPGPNSLLHYAWLGRLLKRPTSAWFDTDFYLRQNRDVARSGADPLQHYLRVGGFEGRSPCKQFDAAFYLSTNPDVAVAQMNPLLHYLRFGRLEGRPVIGDPAQSMPSGAALPAPGEVPADWDDIAPRAAGEALVDVVVPVYRGYAETLRCVRSVLLARNRTPFELVVIDDGSPDTELVQALERHAARGLFTLLGNGTNQGFVRTANTGMALHPERDVVLLNSDTEVFGDWLDRLRDTAYRASRNGTVTPLSNNATIASYPRFLHDNPWPLEISYEELDRLTAGVNRGVSCEAPTGVGFCIYLRRDCLLEVGLFDAETFGRGYGEENDLCQRAIAAGWRNLIAADVFVHHLGSVSFQGERAGRVADALRVLDRSHPSYQRDVRRFIEADPLAAARRALDWARLSRGARERNVLIVCHNRGGGAERHVREDAARLQSEGLGVFFLRPVNGAPRQVRLADARNIVLPNQPLFELDEPELVDALRALPVTTIHVHGTVDFDPSAPAQLVRLARDVGATLELDIHDYQAICPRINLADESGRYCGEPTERGCDTCLQTQGNRYGERSIRSWRAAHAQLLHEASTVWVPDEDVRERLLRYHPELAIAVLPHEEAERMRAPLREPELGEGEPLHIAVIGAISRIKGYDALLGCARDARARRLPLRFSLLGYSLSDAPLLQAGVDVSGRYLETEGMERLRGMAPHVVWLPSLWPETYSYTLSMALQGGYPVFAFDIGAIGRRLRELGQEALLAPLPRQLDPRELNRRFLEYREQHLGTRDALVARAVG